MLELLTGTSCASWLENELYVRLRQVVKKYPSEMTLSCHINVCMGLQVLAHVNDPCVSFCGLGL